MDLGPARDIFRLNHGFAFHIVREGYGPQYRSYGVPPEIEKVWLAELAKDQLEALDRPGNVMAIHFFLGHRDLTRLPELLAAEPLGNIHQRTAYVEELAAYVGACGRKRAYPRAEIRAARAQVRESARTLMRQARSDRTRARISRLLG